MTVKDIVSSSKSGNFPVHCYCEAIINGVMTYFGELSKLMVILSSLYSNDPFY